MTNLSISIIQNGTTVIPTLRSEATDNTDNVFLDDLNPYEINVQITDLKTKRKIILWSYVYCIGDDAYVGFDINDWNHNLHGKAALEAIHAQSNIDLNQHYTKEQAIQLISEVLEKQTLMI
jgi:hypothetical protein